MVYHAWQKGVIQYIGNNIHNPKEIICSDLQHALLQERITRVKQEEVFLHIANIDHTIFQASVEYFLNIGAKWTNLPLTTLMISSPWEVYAGQTIDYTTDTLPVEIPSWFWENRRIFLSESSQFYLELQLLIPWIEQVFSIYNSFRKEKSDATHLSEFQHIEYEWKTDLEWNISVFMWLFQYIFQSLIKNNNLDILYFISEEQLQKKLNI